MDHDRSNPLHRLSTLRSLKHLEQHLAHPSEAAALPLVQSIASFSLSQPSLNASVAICAVPTHEELFLPEWITWHRLLGVERFYLFDNAPSLEMRRLLRPWIEEGVVVLYDLAYDDTVNIGEIYQQHVLRLCEKYVLTTVKWASHHDVDEFLMVDAPGWKPNFPSLLPSSPSSSSSSSDEPAPASDLQQWTYPLHQRFQDLLAESTCVPVLRLPFQNYGIKEMQHGEMVTELHTLRDSIGPDYHTYGKMFLHSDGVFMKAGWMGPHSCKAFPGTVVMNVQGDEIDLGRGTYPFAGLPLPQEGLTLFHYGQRSLRNCHTKFHVLANTPNDWRTKDGLAGCARNYVPTNEELASDTLTAALRAEPFGEELVSRPESWSVLFTRDTRALHSWQGRMTRAILDEWRRKGGSAADEQGRWWWELGPDASDERLRALPVVEVPSVKDLIKGMK
ncbi:hypothetical protein JCM10207_002924 [Rhodosporidiobolus poonsookiae]